MLEYKLEWRGGELIEMGRFDPSSKMCSRCADILSPLKAEVPAPSTVPPSSPFSPEVSFHLRPFFLGLSADSPLPVGTDCVIPRLVKLRDSSPHRRPELSCSYVVKLNAILSFQKYYTTAMYAVSQSIVTSMRP